jgi:hypothetical protein
MGNWGRGLTIFRRPPSDVRITFMAETYRIVRFFQRGGGHMQAREVITEGLTRAQAQAHCQNPETSSKKCTRPENVQRTRERGAWFDGFEAE